MQEPPKILLILFMCAVGLLVGGTAWLDDKQTQRLDQLEKKVDQRVIDLTTTISDILLHVRVTNVTSITNYKIWLGPNTEVWMTNVTYRTNYSPPSSDPDKGGSKGLWKSSSGGAGA